MSEEKQEKRERGKRATPPIGNLAAQFASFGTPAAPELASDVEQASSPFPDVQTSERSDAQPSGRQDVRTAGNPTILPADISDTQTTGSLNAQTSNRLAVQPSSSSAAQFMQHEGVQPSERLVGEAARLPNVQNVNSSGGQTSKTSREQKREREPQTIYLPPEKKTRLHIQAAIERRELSEIVELALDLYYAWKTKAT